MDKFVVRGGNPLLGTIKVSGAKNSALPCMAAAILTEDEVILENIPQVRDIETERKLLESMGAKVELGYGRAQHRTTLCCRDLVNPEASYDLVKTMRASPENICGRWSSWVSPRERSTLLSTSRVTVSSPGDVMACSGGNCRIPSGGNV